MRGVKGVGVMVSEKVEPEAMDPGRVDLDETTDIGSAGVGLGDWCTSLMVDMVDL